ncbi:MAG: hypothetical protein REI78_00095 [Pedobacter sp.]|nr:hypothetical protein [Pedobacter sp.]MDQ8051387.1 hypothetical protein [Pedobacter sp.]
MGTEVYVILFMIGICSYFLWSRLLKKISNPIKRKCTIWALTLIGTPLVYILIVGSFFMFLTYYPDRDFDRIRWKAYPEQRYELSKDLMNSKLLIGKSKAQVNALLGDSAQQHQEVWIYDLGFVPGIANIDPDILIVTFKNGRVVSVAQSRT